MHTLLLTLKDGKTREYPLRSLPAVVGRAEGAQVRIPHQSLDPEHARLVERDGDLYVEDLGSESGVLVNRKKVSESVLISGDELRLGVAVFKVHVEEELVLPGQAKPEARPKPKARAVRPQDIRVKSEILQFNKIDARKGDAVWLAAAPKAARIVTGRSRLAPITVDIGARSAVKNPMTPPSEMPRRAVEMTELAVSWSVKDASTRDRTTARKTSVNAVAPTPMST